jgi:hypothetical protein
VSRTATATKKGPGRKARASFDGRAPSTMAAPESRRKLRANVGRNPVDQTRRVWRDGEPVHIVKPVRSARRAHAAIAEREGK